MWRGNGANDDGGATERLGVETKPCEQGTMLLERLLFGRREMHGEWKQQLLGRCPALLECAHELLEQDPLVR
jgi:hypothetical protein